jgi:hypothetical protein
LLNTGADPSPLRFEARRALVGLPSRPELRLLQASEEEFQRGWRPRFGTANPEEISEPFWRSMVLSGMAGYQAADRFHERVAHDRDPVWCAQRFGQSMTFLPDGRTVQIGGEHEDYYDPDFCIYNDVFVHESDGSFRILGYPEEDFPPTDFHSATLVGQKIYIIGSLGYVGTRRFGSTPVHVLDTETLRIERLETSGDTPGWIYRHRAVLSEPRKIRVYGGKVAAMVEDKEVHADNERVFALDLDLLTWSTAAGWARR